MRLTVVALRLSGEPNGGLRGLESDKVARQPNGVLHVSSQAHDNSENAQEIHMGIYSWELAAGTTSVAFTRSSAKSANREWAGWLLKVWLVGVSFW